MHMSSKYQAIDRKHQALGGNFGIYEIHWHVVLRSAIMAMGITHILGKDSVYIRQDSQIWIYNWQEN